MPRRWLSPISLSHAHRPLISSVDIQQYFWRDPSNLEGVVLCCHVALAKKKKKPPLAFHPGSVGEPLTVSLSSCMRLFHKCVISNSPHCQITHKKTLSPHLNVLECSSVFNDLLNVTAHFLLSNSAFPDAVSLTTLIFSLYSQPGEPSSFQILFFNYIGVSSPEVDPQACEEASVWQFFKLTVNITVHLKLDLSRFNTLTGVKPVHRVMVPKHLGSRWCTLELFKPELLGNANEITNERATGLPSAQIKNGLTWQHHAPLCPVSRTEIHFW